MGISLISTISQINKSLLLQRILFEVAAGLYSSHYEKKSDGRLPMYICSPSEYFQTMSYRPAVNLGRQFSLIVNIFRQLSYHGE